MRIILLITTLLFLTLTQTIAQPVTFDWSRAISGKTSLPGKVSMAKDSNGDIYVLGQFSGTRQFGPTQLTALGTTDVFVAKLSAFGPILWAVRGGSSFSNAIAGAITISGNNIYITGGFSNFISFGTSCVTNNTNSSNNTFIASLNTSNGACNWITKVDGAYENLGNSITPAIGGGFFVCGTFRGAATFDSYTLNTSVLLDSDIYYAKYNASGTCEWAKAFGGFGFEFAGGIRQINSNEIVMNGSFEDVISYPGGSITSYGSTDFFLAKFNGSGTITWAVKGGGIESEVANGIDVDTAGNIYSTGFIGNDVTFGTIFLPSQQSANVFLTKHSPTGICQWIRMGGTQVDDIGQDIATDPNGSSYVTGYVSGNASFGSTILTGVQGYDSFVVKYNTWGDLIWITKIGSTGTEIGKAIVYNATGSIFAAGEFDGTLNLTANPISTPGAGIYSVYVTKIGGGSVGLNAETNDQTISLFPNPTSEFINLNLTKIKDAAFTIELFSADGRLILSKLLTGADAVAAYPIDVKDFASGNYIVKVSSSIGEYAQPVVISRN